MKVFSASIWARDGGYGIRPIDSVQEAQIFLDGWPMEGRTPLYYLAANSMKSAEEGSIPPEEAIDWVCAQPNIESIVFGASSRRNIASTRALVDKSWAPVPR